MANTQALQLSIEEVQFHDDVTSYASNARWEVACDGRVCERVFIVNVKWPQCRSHVQDTGACHMKSLELIAGGRLDK